MALLRPSEDGKPLVNVAQISPDSGKRRPVGYLDPARYARTWTTRKDQGVLAGEP